MEGFATRCFFLSDTIEDLGQLYITIVPCITNPGYFSDDATSCPRAWILPLLYMQSSM